MRKGEGNMKLNMAINIFLSFHTRPKCRSITAESYSLHCQHAAVPFVCPAICESHFIRSSDRSHMKLNLAIISMENQGYIYIKRERERERERERMRNDTSM